MVIKRLLLIITGYLTLLAFHAGDAFAQPLPGPADIDLVKPVEQPRFTPRTENTDAYVPPPLSPDTPPPEGAAEIMTLLHQINIEGVTVFPAAELQELYAPYLGREVPLDTVWKIAAALTDKYRNAGYFLSRAYIPAQNVDNGVFLIKVVEGHVGKVSVSGAEHRIIDDVAAEIKSHKPTNIRELERELLLLNDLPGLTFQSTLAPLDEPGDEAAVHLLLSATETEGTGSVSVDNAGSRFLGPYQVAANWDFSPLEMQKTAISAITAPFGKELYAISVLHKVFVSAATNADFSLSNTHARPGYTLEVQDIRSRSSDVSIGFSHKIIRQRGQNLTGRLSLDMRNSNSDILGGVLSRDKTRVLNANLDYDVADPFGGYNYIGLTLRQGLDALGSSNAGGMDISRLGAKPDFFKMQMSYTRLQDIGRNFSGVLSLAGQQGSGSLYSSEEFGYGGTTFGRAYDNSEISGDDGVSATAELRYHGLKNWNKLSGTPYVFYDVGKVWNDNAGQESEMSGASAGIGLYFQYNSAIYGNIYAAQPLTKSIDTPLNGGNGKNPRYMFQVSYKF